MRINLSVRRLGYVCSMDDEAKRYSFDDLRMTWWRDAPRGGLQAEGGGVEAGGGEAAHKAQAPMYILLFRCLQQNSSHFISHPQPTPTPLFLSPL